MLVTKELCKNCPLAAPGRGCDMRADCEVMEFEETIAYIRAHFDEDAVEGMSNLLARGEGVGVRNKRLDFTGIILKA